ncbi:ankyrin repeat domain-containing protein SOWAHA [Struthio camelus]|uniref:ankyrin repeat domain-containing protein SOWAHA n=1 Tax=Struthio camelus TaxID=8801 RepID=UPI0036041ECC
MAELDVSPAAVLGFLRERGGRVRNAELLSRFRPLLEAAAEPAERAARRERFKAAVNAVAVVKERDGAKFVVLRKALRGGGGAAPAEELPAPAEELPAPPAGLPAPAPPEELPSPGAVSKLRGHFQSQGGEAPLPAGWRDPPARRDPPAKPCMLPVRCPPPAPAEPGPRSPPLRRAPKSQRAGEETAAVPLEEAEHRWLVKAAGGRWSPELHGLLLGDASLAARRDFMSGFTALHWAAKCGNCDMAGKIIEVAAKAGGHVNVNAKSYGGYTALHVAAMHGREEIITMLVRSYNAKTNLRDYSGKKPHQYLKDGASFAVRHLLGDPDLRSAAGPSLPIRKNAKIAASILSSTSTFLGVISDDMAFYDLTKGLRKPSSLNKLLAASTGPRKKPKTRGSFPSYSSLCEVVEE